MDKAIEIVNQWIAKNDPAEVLNLSLLHLEELPTIPLSCQNLHCYCNKLKFLPELPNCEILVCSGNELTSLPQLPKCINLYCANNQLTMLPQLPNCEDLNCCNNQLMYLPKLPKCVWLDCCKNNLRSLPKLLKCSYGQLNFDDDYIYIEERIAKEFRLEQTPNYNKFVQIIQRAYKKYMRRKYQQIMTNFLYAGPSKVVTLFII